MFKSKLPQLDTRKSLISKSKQFAQSIDEVSESIYDNIKTKSNNETTTNNSPEIERLLSKDSLEKKQRFVN